MAIPMVVKVACLAVMCMVLGLPLAHAAFTCNQVATYVAPCIPYLRGIGSSVPGPCCNGVKNLNSQAKTTPDRQAICRCIKSSAQSLPGLNLANLAGLPGKCGINLNYKLSPSIDCSKYTTDHDHPLFDYTPKAKLSN